jgi:hypothetical protein
MKLTIIFFLIFICTLNAKCQVNNRILTYDTKVIQELNEPLIASIERHLKVSKAEKGKSEYDFFILVSIFPRIKEWEIPKHVFDSIYAINDFKGVFPADSATPTYSISIVLASKKDYTEGWTGFGRKNIYYYKYKNYDVLISSDLNLIFKYDNERRQFVITLNSVQNPKEENIFKVWTGYSMWNRYVTEIRMKDLIWPTWTGNRDDFN